MAALLGRTGAGQRGELGVPWELDNRTVSYTLVPPPGAAGPEYAFSRPVPKGQIITILSAWQQFIPFMSGVYYLVELEQSDLPQGVPVRLDLYRGNEGDGVELNPAIYRKLPKDN